MKTKNPIPENKVDELKALIARSILIKIEQKKIEEKLHEIAKYYDEDSLKSIHEPIGDSMMSVVGLDILRKHPKKIEEKNTTSK